MAYPAVFTRAALVLVFGLAVVGKLRSRRHYLSFVESLRPFVPARFVSARPASAIVSARPASAVLSASAASMLTAEFACAVLLALPATSRLSHWLAAVLLAVVTGAAGWAVAARRPAACQCFGGTARPLGRVHVIRNSLLLTLAVIGGLVDDGPMHAGGVVLAVAAGAVGALLLIRMDDLLALGGARQVA